ncbi:hypothetical protein JCM11641_001292 [Rhodosporidiobolus odoratus]
MVPQPGSSPPLSPLSSSTSSLPSTPAQDYAHIVRSLQRRSQDRLLQDDNLSNPAKSTQPVSHDLEADLRLAAELGQALLRDKTQLQQRVELTEKSRAKMLDRLTHSVKENDRLQRRLEETVGSLEQADASNRALLVSLEEDRKTISRLSVDSAKLVSTTSALQALKRQHEDTLEELSAERRRADAAEAKSKKLGERTAELEVRLKKALEDLEELRQDKVLRSRKSHDALAKARARYARDGGLAAKEPLAGVEGLSENTEAKELLKMVETLVSENTLLRSESMELHGLLEMSRDEQVDLRSAMAEQAGFPEEEEDQLLAEAALPTHRRHHSLASNFSGPLFPHCDSVVSPSVSQALTDYDLSRRPLSPGSTRATSFNRSWAQSASLSGSHRAVDLSRTFSASSFGSEDQAAIASQLQFAGVDPRTRQNSRRRPPPAASSSTGVLNGGKVPLGGRGHTRRAMSVDVTPYIRTGTESAPTSPRLDFSPVTRPASIFSNASEDPDPATRSRRHHRPLSLSLGPSLFPQVLEDADSHPPPISPFTRQPSQRRRPSQHAGPRLSRSPDRPVVTVDSGTQTTPPATPAQPSSHLHRSETAGTPHRGLSFASSRSSSPHPGPAPSSTSISEVSEDRSFELQASPGGSGAPTSLQTQVEQRTAALGQLIEHVSKLLSRVQAADIATQEKRLKKQNLPGGDVKHLAQANLRDLVNDIDGVRQHFRRVVELERATHAKKLQSGQPDDTASTNPNDSLVSRRDFVSLVKLLRDLLYETTRLRSIVNRVQLEPSLAPTMKELDVPTVLDPDHASGGAAGASKGAPTSGGLLAPLSRLFGATLSPDEPSLSHRSSMAQLRPPPPKRGGSSTVSTATVNVEFGSGGVRQASSTAPSSEAPGSSGNPLRASLVPPRPSLPAKAQVKRDISSIFAGASTRSSTLPAGPEPWVVVSPTSGASVSPSPLSGPSPIPAPATRLASAATAASSYLPFSRYLSSCRPAMSSTTNAVLDSLPHAPPSHSASSSAAAAAQGYSDPPPTLLERQLRPRGLSDSSIRSTFISHSHGGGGSGVALRAANPHHRLISPAGLALSSESTRAVAVAAAVVDGLGTSPGRGSDWSAVSGADQGGGGAGLGAMDALRGQLSEGSSSSSILGGAGAAAAAAAAGEEGKSISRRPSTAKLLQLRPKPSKSRLNSTNSATTLLLSVSPISTAPPVPPLPSFTSDTAILSTSSAATSDSTLLRHQAAPPSRADLLPSTSAGAGAEPISIAGPTPRESFGSTEEEEEGGGGGGGIATSPTPPTSGAGGGAGNGGAAGLFGTMVASAFESIAGPVSSAGVLGASSGSGSGGGGGGMGQVRREGKIGSVGGGGMAAESWREKGRFG